MFNLILKHFRKPFNKNRWPAFEERYMEELEKNPAMQDFINRIKKEKTVTLLGASKNTIENHAIVLQKYLEKALE